MFSRNRKTGSLVCDHPRMHTTHRHMYRWDHRHTIWYFRAIRYLQQHKTDYPGLKPVCREMCPTTYAISTPTTKWVHESSSLALTFDHPVTLQTQLWPECRKLTHIQSREPRICRSPPVIRYFVSWVEWTSEPQLQEVVAWNARTAWNIKGSFAHQNYRWGQIT